MSDLTPFRRARSLRWHRLTEFVAGYGDDGTLLTEQGHAMPLDTALPYERTRGPAPRQHTITDDGVGIAITNPHTLAEAHAAIRGWCHVHLGRDDIHCD